MLRISTLALLVATSILLAGCGGDDDSSSTKDSKEPKVDRSGYFSNTQSEEINPALADWNTAKNAYDSNFDACNAEADKRYKQGATPAKAVECHLRDTKAMLVAVAGIRDVTTEFVDAGEWRTECDEELASFNEALARQEAAWKTLQADWVAYTKGRATPKINAHSIAASDVANEFAATTVPDLATACYTKADREEAEQDTEEDDDAAATKDDESDESDER